NNQFEGNWHINTTKYKGNDKFNLHFHEKSLAIESNSYGTFNVNTCYTKLLNNYVTHEDYLYLLSIINPQLNQLVEYRYLYRISIILLGLVCLASFPLVVECPSLCPENIINPIATTPSSTIQLSMDEFQSEMANQIHSSSEPVQYNPQLDTIITLEPNK
ncbi:unnamed protein product, partial [Adineta steineri]